MNALYAALFSWAVTLSGYPATDMPEVKVVPHSTLEEMACGGKTCRVLGLYDPKQPNTVWIDGALDLQDTYSSSILVHEFVHYLQNKAGKVAFECEAAIENEREAYAVQTEFLHRYGIYRPAFASKFGMNC